MEKPRRTILICLSVAAPVGAGIGAAFGATNDNMLYWASMGFAMGTFVGTVTFLALSGWATEQNEGNGPSSDPTKDTSEE